MDVLLVGILHRSTYTNPVPHLRPRITCWKAKSTRRSPSQVLELDAGDTDTSTLLSSVSVRSATERGGTGVALLLAEREARSTNANAKPRSTQGTWAAWHG